MLTPKSFFELFQLGPPRYPAIWSTLGMVLGLYGLLYAYAAFHLEWARPVIAVGLAGKILGPIGWLLSIHAGELPIRTFPLIAFDDIVWWLPFGLYLLEGSAAGTRLRALAAPVCAVINAVAAVALLLVLKPGLPQPASSPGRLVPSPGDYILAHALTWRLGWGIWIVASLTLVAFYGWWGSRLGYESVALAAVGVAIIGIACDISAELLLIGWLPYNYGAVVRLAAILTGGAANGLYTVAGIVLTLITPFRSTGFRAWTWAVWAAGALLSVFAVADWTLGIMASTAVLFVLFCPWAYAMRGQLR